MRKAQPAVEAAPPVVLDVAQVAQILRVPESTIRAMTRDGRLARVAGLGRTVRIPRWSVELLIGEQRGPDASGLPPLRSTRT